MYFYLQGVTAAATNIGAMRLAGTAVDATKSDKRKPIYDL